MYSDRVIDLTEVKQIFNVIELQDEGNIQLIVNIRKTSLYKNTQNKKLLEIEHNGKLYNKFGKRFHIYIR